MTTMREVPPGYLRRAAMMRRLRTRVDAKEARDGCYGQGSYRYRGR